MTADDYSADFHDFGGAVYLNCAFHGAMPRCATRAVEAALELKRRPHLIRDEDHFTYPDAYRAAVAELIGADQRDVAVTGSATQGTMILVSGLDWREGDEVLVPAGEFPSNRFPWKSLESRGVRVRELPLGSPEQAIEAVEAALGERTRVVSLSWVSYSSGLRIDLAAIGGLCRERGALFAVDVSQGVGGLAFDVAGAPIDLVTCAGYKWMLGPYGIGFAWVRPGLAERLAVANVNWFSTTGARDFNRLSRGELEFVPGARKFDLNEPGNFLNMAGAAASARYLASVGIEAVERHDQALLDRLIEGLPAGMRSLAPGEGDARSNILCIDPGSERAGDEAFARLVAARIHLSRREGALRVSPHVYNTADEIDRLLEVLAGRSVQATHTPVRGRPVPASGPAERPEHRILEGRYVRLRPIDPGGDAAALYPGSHTEATREATWAYLPYGPFESVEGLHQLLEAHAASRDPLFSTVERLDTGEPVGVVAFMRVEPEMRTLELGHIWYVEAARRTEANTEAVHLMLREAFDRLGYRRVEWKCDALNHPSRRAALRLGFTFEGIFRQHLIVKGRNRDTAWYALLDGDWPRVRADLERWLASEADERPSLAALERRP